MSNFARSACALVVPLLACAPGAQAPVNASLLTALTPTSAHLASAKIIREGDTVLLLGASGNRLRLGRSADGGRTWPTGLQTLLPTVSDYGFAASGQRVFLAWQADGSTTRQLGLSTNGGATFPTVRLLPNGRHAPQLYANGPDVILLQLGDPSGVVAVHTGNGGATWSPTVDLAQGLGGTNASDHDLHLIADGREIIAVWQRRTPTHHVASCRSTDGGATWSTAHTWPVNAPLLAVAAEHGRWFAQAGSTLWRSTNHGVTWVPLPGHGFPFPKALAMHGLRMLAVESLGLNAPLRVAASLDGGDTWSISPTTLPGWMDLEASVVGDAMFVVVEGRGVHQSDDGGVTWRMVENQEMVAWHARSDGAIAVAFVTGSAPGDYVWVSEGHTRLGAGTAGTGGLVPSLRGAGLAGIGRSFSLELGQAVGGSLAAFLLTIGNASVAVLAATSGTPGQPGAGGAAHAITVPANPAFVGVRLVSRGYVLDAAAMPGYCTTEERESWIR